MIINKTYIEKLRDKVVKSISDGMEEAIQIKRGEVEKYPMEILNIEFALGEFYGIIKCIDIADESRRSSRETMKIVEGDLATLHEALDDYYDVIYGEVA